MSEDHSKYSEDELKTPEWLNEAFFEEVLTKKFSKDAKLKSCLISPGTTKSDHYGSTIYRAKLTYILSGEKTENFQSLIIKSLPDSGAKSETLGPLKQFETEIRMYTETLPKIDGILKSCGDDTKLSVETFYHSLTPRKCLILDDLCQWNYKTISQRPCSLDEVRAALKKLSRLHAVSKKLAEEGDTSITSYKDGSFCSPTIEEHDIVSKAAEVFKGVLSEYDDLKAYVPAIERVEKDLIPKTVQSFKAYANGQREGIMVLNHGDFHVKNLLIREKEGQLDDLVLLDYQFCYMGSAALDLIYAYIMMFNAEMRSVHRDDLFYYYFTEFQQTLKRIGYKGTIPTVLDFQKELLKHVHWEIFLLVAFLNLQYNLTDTDGDLVRMVEDAEYRRESFHNPKLLNELRELLPRYLHKGYLGN